MFSEVLLFLSQYLTLCGDIQLMLAQNANNRAAHLEEFNYQTKEDQEILLSLHRESGCHGGPAGPARSLGFVPEGRRGPCFGAAVLFHLFLDFNMCLSIKCF